MKKSKAIQILEKQRIKLENNEFYADDKWVIQTQDYIGYFFGKDSAQFQYIKNFSFHYFTIGGESKEKIRYELDNIRKNAIQFMYDCIEIINDKGIVNQNHNFLERINNQTIITIILFLVSGLLYIGYLFGISTTDSKNIELRQENKQLKDSLSIIRMPIKKPNNITK